MTSEKHFFNDTSQRKKKRMCDLLSTMTEGKIEIVDPDGMRTNAGFVIGRYKGKSIKMNFYHRRQLKFIINHAPIEKQKQIEAIASLKSECVRDCVFAAFSC